MALEVAFDAAGNYEARATTHVAPCRVERGAVGTPVVAQKGKKKLSKTLRIDRGGASVSIKCEDGQCTVWAPGLGGTLVVTSTFPAFTDKPAVLTFTRGVTMFAQDDREDMAMEGLEEEDEDPFARHEPWGGDQALFLGQLNSVVATAGLKYKDQSSAISAGEEEAWNLFIMTEHCAPHLEWAAAC